MLRQQLAASRLIEDAGDRISVMLRAADLLWLWDEETARTSLKDALNIATDAYRETRERQRLDSAQGGALPDMRFKVIAAIGKRDLAWARKLSDQILKDDADRAAGEATSDPQQSAETAERLLSAALSLLPSNQTSALAFASMSLRYSATTYLPIFLYKLAEADRLKADQFYQQSLSAYAASPMNQFLFLSSYPFGNNREAGEMPNWTVYVVPSTFRPSPNLQRLFLTALMRRARLMIENPSVIDAGTRLSDSDQAWIALTRLKGQIDQFMSEFSAEADELRGTLFAVHSQQDQQRLVNTTASPPRKSFGEKIEQAERVANPARREEQIALAILAAKNEPLQHVVDAAGKIDDVELRESLLSWLYFERAQQAVNQDLEQAQKLAEKVRELDLRAFLFSKIAEETIKQTKIDAKAREILEQVLVAVAKAADTEVKARALLVLAYLYSKIDANRSIAVLGDAVKSINNIESPDFSKNYFERKIKGRTFTTYAILKTSSFNPESGFREIGKIDSDGARTLATAFKHKYLRAMITLVLAEQCLQSKDQLKEPKKDTKRE